MQDIRHYIDLIESASLIEDSEQPAYEHDCDKCEFVGYDQPESGEPAVNVVDMYLHKKPSGYTLIRRYSSDPPNYSSTEYDPNKSTPKWTKVINAAKRKGLLK